MSEKDNKNTVGVDERSKTVIETTTDIQEEVEQKITSDIQEEAEPKIATEVQEVAEPKITTAVQEVAEQKTTEEKEFTGEDNLELYRMSPSERRKAKKERYRKNTEGMTTKEKISYFIYYYKWPVIFGSLFIFIAIYAAVSIYNNTRPIALGYAIVNSSDPDHVNQDIIDEYMACYDFDGGYQIMADKEVRMSYDEYIELSSQGNMDNNTDYSQFPLLCWNGYYDIIFTDKAGLEYCGRESVIEPLDSAFTKDLNDIIYSNYNNLLVEAPNYDGNSIVYAIDVTNCEKIKELNLGLEEVYICFPANTPQNDDRDRNLANRKRFLKFIFDLDIEI